MSKVNLLPRWSAAAFGVIGIYFLTPPTADAQSNKSPAPGKTYQIVSTYSGKCVDRSGRAFADGVQLQQSNCSSSSSQKFRMLDATRNSFYFVGQESGNYIKAGDIDDGNGIAVIESRGSEGDTPRMYLTPSHGGSFTIKFANSDKCLDIDGPTLNVGGRLHQWDCLGHASQDWQFVEQTEGLGQQAWTLPRTNLFKDSFNRLFRQAATEDGVVVTSLDASTGKDNWVQTFPHSYSIYPFCGDQNHFFVFGQGQLRAIDPLKGDLLWIHESHDSKNNLYCIEGEERLFLSSNELNTKLTQLDRRTGQQVWTFRVDGYASILGSQGNNVYVSVYKDDVNSLLALDAKTGTLRWSKALTVSQYLAMIGPADVFLQDSRSITKINPADGAALWSFQGNGSEDDLYLDWNTGNVIFARQGKEISRLASRDGQVLWTVSTPQSFDYSNSALITLKGGMVLMNTFDSTQELNQASLFDVNGKTLWSTTFAGAFAYPSTDRAGNLFFGNGQKLTAVDLTTGRVRWNYVHSGSYGFDHIYGFETFGSDVFITYGGEPARYPPMGIVRLDAKTGTLQWDVWVGESTTLIGVANGLLLTNRVMGTGVISYKL